MQTGGTGRATDVGRGRVEVGVCSKGSVACGLDRETQGGWISGGEGGESEISNILNQEVLATVTLGINCF